MRRLGAAPLVPLRQACRANLGRTNGARWRKIILVHIFAFASFGPMMGR